MSNESEDLPHGAFDKAKGEAIGVWSGIVIETVAVLLALAGWYCVDELKNVVGEKVAGKPIFSFLAAFAQISIGVVFVLHFVRTALVLFRGIVVAARDLKRCLWPHNPEREVHQFKVPVSEPCRAEGPPNRLGPEHKETEARPSLMPKGGGQP